MILNEYRLMPWQKEAQEVILKHMEDFFFGEGAALPPGYVPQQSKGERRVQTTRHGSARSTTNVSSRVRVPERPLDRGRCRGLRENEPQITRALRATARAADPALR